MHFLFIFFQFLLLTLYYIADSLKYALQFGGENFIPYKCSCFTLKQIQSLVDSTDDQSIHKNTHFESFKTWNSSVSFENHFILLFCIELEIAGLFWNLIRTLSTCICGILAFIFCIFIHKVKWLFFALCYRFKHFYRFNFIPSRILSKHKNICFSYEISNLK